MDKNLGEFLDSLKDASASVIKKEVSAFLDDVKHSGDAFAVAQGPRIEKYLLQLASKQITAKELEGYMEDIKAEAEMEMRLNKVKTKASAQRIHDGIANVILGKFLNILM